RPKRFNAPVYQASSPDGVASGIPVLFLETSSMADSINRVQTATGSLVKTAVQRRKRRKNKGSQASAAQPVPSQAEIRSKLINMAAFNKVSFPTAVVSDSFIDPSF